MRAPGSQSREESGEAGPCGLHMDKKEPGEKARETEPGAFWLPREESGSGRRRDQAEMRGTVSWA